MLWRLAGVTVGAAAALFSFPPLREGLPALTLAFERALHAVFSGANTLAAQTLSQLAPSLAAIAVGTVAVAGVKARRIAGGSLAVLVVAILVQQETPLPLALVLAVVAASAFSTFTGAALVLPLSAAAGALALEGARQSFGLVSTTFAQLRQVPSGSAEEAALLAAALTWESAAALGASLLALVALRIVLIPR